MLLELGIGLKMCSVVLCCVYCDVLCVVGMLDVLVGGVLCMVMDDGFMERSEYMFSCVMSVVMCCV